MRMFIVECGGIYGYLKVLHRGMYEEIWKAQ
jgi:hypothetical protein